MTVPLAVGEAATAAAAVGKLLLAAVAGGWRLGEVASSFPFLSSIFQLLFPPLLANLPLAVTVLTAAVEVTEAAVEAAAAVGDMLFS